MENVPKGRLKVHLYKWFYSVTAFLLLVALTHPAFAGDNRWEIKQDSLSSDRYSMDIEMRKKNDYDPSNKFRGTMDNDGYTRMRDLNGNTVRGYIDQDGYGRLRDQDGNTFRVRPD
jgi:hypothetical protein